MAITNPPSDGKTSITKIQQGDFVSPSVTNAPINNIESNINDLWTWADTHSSDIDFLERNSSIPEFSDDIPAPTLALYASPGVDAPSNLTVSRATTATYTDAFGVIKTAASGELRGDHDPVTGQFKGWLIEGDSTNLITYSEDFSNAAWEKQTCSIQANATTAPDGTLTADKLVSNAITNRIAARQFVTVTPGQNYAHSIYVKAAGFNLVTLFMNKSDSNRPDGTDESFRGSAVRINLTTGVSSDTSIVTSESAGRGWWRLSVVGSYDTTTALLTIALLTATTGIDNTPGDGVSGIYIWGAQLEAGEFPSSYIKTTSTSVTRAYDEVSISGSQFADFYNPREMSFFIDLVNYFPPSGSGAFQYFFGFSPGTTTANFVGVAQVSTSSGGSVQLRSDGTDMNLGVLPQGRKKIAFSMDGSSSAISLNGGAVFTSTKAKNLSVLDTLTLGSLSRTSTFASKIHVRSVLYFPRRLSNSTLQDLTK